jgi:hypothetical protein
MNVRRERVKSSFSSGLTQRKRTLVFQNSVSQTSTWARPHYLYARSVGDRCNSGGRNGNSLIAYPTSCPILVAVGQGCPTDYYLAGVI